MLKRLVESVAALRSVHDGGDVPLGDVVERTAAEQGLHHVLGSRTGYADSHVVQGVYIGFKIFLVEMVGNTAEVVEEPAPVHAAAAGKGEQGLELRGELQEHHVTERQRAVGDDGLELHAERLHLMADLEQVAAPIERGLGRTEHHARDIPYLRHDLRAHQ